MIPMDPASIAVPVSLPTATTASTQLQPPALAPRTRDVLVLIIGLGALLGVPLFKQATGLPPYMGMLSGLGVLWLVTDALHAGEDRTYPRVQDALRNIDIAGMVLLCARCGGHSCTAPPPSHDHPYSS